MMVGSYPVGAKNWDNCKGGGNKEQLWRSVADLGKVENWLKVDPVYGSDAEAPLFKAWRR